MEIEEKKLTEQEVADLKEKEEKLATFDVMANKLRKIQDDVLTDYFTTPAVARFNYLEHLKPLLTAVTTAEQLKVVLEKEMAIMKGIGREFTRIELLEYRFCKKIYKDVALGKGEQFGAGRDMIYHYDEQEILVEPIKLGDIKEEYES